MITGLVAPPLLYTYRNGAGLHVPFTPLVLFWVVHILLLLGFARHSLRLSGSFSGLERWVVLVYPFGLGLLMLVYYWIGWRIRPELAGLPLVYWLEGPLALLVAGLTQLWMGRNERVWSRSRMIIELLFSLRWLSWQVFQPLDWRLVSSPRSWKARGARGSCGPCQVLPPDCNPVSCMMSETLAILHTSCSERFCTARQPELRISITALAFRTRDHLLVATCRREAAVILVAGWMAGAA
jgi:hypothetical protein